jgi:hypothetical protein
MFKRMLAVTLALSGASLSVAEAQTPTKAEAQAIAATLKPVFFDARTTSASAAFDRQTDHVVVTHHGVKVEAGQRVRYDPCNDILDYVPDNYVKVLDSATIVVTRMGPLRVTIADVSSVLANFTITDVIHRGGADGDWKITYEHVTIWPRDRKLPNDECTIVR